MNGSRVTITFDGDEAESPGLPSDFMNLFSGSSERERQQPPPFRDDSETPRKVLAVDGRGVLQDAPAGLQDAPAGSGWEAQLQQFVAAHDVVATIRTARDELKKKQQYVMPIQ